MHNLIKNAVFRSRLVHIVSLVAGMLFVTPAGRLTSCFHTHRAGSVVYCAPVAQ